MRTTRLTLNSLTIAGSLAEQQQQQHLIGVGAVAAYNQPVRTQQHSTVFSVRLGHPDGSKRTSVAQPPRSQSNPWRKRT